MDFTRTKTYLVSWKICFLTAWSSISVALGAVPQPENVNVTSVNLDVILTWDPPRDTPGNLTYTASYESVMGSTTVCQHQSDLSCDFTNHLSYFGIYKFSVRAELQGEVSQWVNTSKFVIDLNTVIGAPSVRLSSRGVNMDVAIRDPVTRNPGALRKLYSDVCFNVRYWRENKTETATMLQCEQQNSLVLSDLMPRTRYCVQAQMNVPSYEKLSNFSSVTCETTGDESVTAGFIAVTMVISLLVVAGTVLILFFIGWYGYKRVKYMFPKVKMPEHFKEFLLDPPNSHILLAMQNSPQPEETCHDVCILQEAPESKNTGSGATL
ncbi:hypothetical protein GJAV_G00254630 [Gymnothorax javanicus]|nr:hypothetical protein GJAV_G00254630 [Gymnothorax javanicus]